MDGPHEGSKFMSIKWTDPTRDQDSCPQSGRTPWGIQTYISPQGGWTSRGIKIHVHKMDRPHEGSKFMSTKWTDPTRVKNLRKSIKGTDPTRDQNSCPRSGRSQQGLKTFIGPQSGRTPRGIKIHVHKMDGPHERSKFMSTKWTDPTRVKNLHKSTKEIDPTRD